MSLLTQISIALIMLNCPMPEVVNHWAAELDDKDYKVLLTNVASCKRWFDNGYCMSKFTKLGTANYHITCHSKETQIPLIKGVKW